MREAGQRELKPKPDLLTGCIFPKVPTQSQTENVFFFKKAIFSVYVDFVIPSFSGLNFIVGFF